MSSLCYDYVSFLSDLNVMKNLENCDLFVNRFQKCVLSLILNFNSMKVKHEVITSWISLRVYDTLQEVEKVYM